MNVEMTQLNVAYNSCFTRIWNTKIGACVYLSCKNSFQLLNLSSVMLKKGIINRAETSFIPHWEVYYD